MEKGLKIGNTPLVECKVLKRQFALQARIFAKAEYANEGGSIKDRVALAIIEDAEQTGALKKGGYIDCREDGGLVLTELGLNVAEMMYERHTVLTDYLVSLGVERSIATEDACKIEHVISNETFNAIKNNSKKN